MTAKTQDTSTSEKYPHGKIGYELIKMQRQAELDKKNHLYAEYCENIDRWMMKWVPSQLRKKLEKCALKGEDHYEFDVVTYGAIPEATRQYIFERLTKLKFGHLTVKVIVYREPIHTVRIGWA